MILHQLLNNLIDLVRENKRIHQGLYPLTFAEIRYVPYAPKLVIGKNIWVLRRKTSNRHKSNYCWVVVFDKGFQEACGTNSPTMLLYRYLVKHTTTINDIKHLTIYFPRHCFVWDRNRFLLDLTEIKL